MKFKIAALAVVGMAAMAAGAFAQTIIFEHSGRHHRVGIGLNLGGGSYYSQPSYYYGHPHETYYTPPVYTGGYGYHAHHVDSQVTPYSGATTVFDHYGALHTPSQSTTYHHPSYGYSPYYGSSYYYYRH